MAHHPEYSYIDPETGNRIWAGPLEITPGDHHHMPQRDASYPSSEYERGHNNASSLGGGNGRDNISAQHRDVNRGAMRAVERGETAALRSGASIDSVRTVVVNGPPDSKTPEAFLISDTVTYPDGHVESIHHSFANIGYAEQAEMEAISASLPDAIDAPNPGDALRASMSPESYAELMEATDAELPSIADTYASADFSGALPEPDTASDDPECSADADSRTDSSAAPDAAAEAEADSDPDPDPD